MKFSIKLGLMILLVGAFLAAGIQEAKAAYSPFDFAIPVETKRYEFSIALIRQDNTMKLIPVEGNLTCAAISPRGDKVAYVIKEKERLTVFKCGVDGNNVEEITHYRCDSRNIQDFIELRFIKGGDMLIITKFIKSEIAFIEHNLKKDRTRFISKTEWKGTPFNVRAVDPFSNGKLIFKLSSHQGGRIIQQIWSSDVYGDGATLFLEIEAPPSIFDVIPDMKNNRIFIVGTQSRNPSVRTTNKSLMLVVNMEDEPEILANDANFLNVDISADRKSIVWRSNSVNPEKVILLKRYNMDTGEVTTIPAEPETEGEESAQAEIPVG